MNSITLPLNTTISIASCQLVVAQQYRDRGSGVVLPIKRKKQGPAMILPLETAVVFGKLGGWGRKTWRQFPSEFTKRDIVNIKRIVSIVRFSRVIKQMTGPVRRYVVTWQTLVCYRHDGHNQSGSHDAVKKVAKCYTLKLFPSSSASRRKRLTWLSVLRQHQS